MRRLAFSTFTHIAADVHRSHASPATKGAKHLATSEGVECKGQQQQRATPSSTYLSTCMIKIRSRGYRRRSTGNSNQKSRRTATP
eukprot:5576384-Amphidinium_carterae.1